MSDRATFVSFLLDETGSMQRIKQPTVEGFNRYLETLQASDADIAFSLVTFNSNKTRRRWVAEPVREVPPLTAEDYQPAAMTPLIDAAVKIIEATAEAVEHRGDDPNVVVVMQTDGRENVSVEYDRADLAALIKEKTEAGWEFVFLGAGLDAFDAAREAGVHLSASRVMSYQGERSTAAFAATAMNTKDYAEMGDAEALDFSETQREGAGDEWSGRRAVGKKRARTGGESSRRPKKGARASTTSDYDLKNG